MRPVREALERIKALRNVPEAERNEDWKKRLEAAEAEASSIIDRLAPSKSMARRYKVQSDLPLYRKEDPK